MIKTESSRDTPSLYEQGRCTSDSTGWSIPSSQTGSGVLPFGPNDTHMGRSPGGATLTFLSHNMQAPARPRLLQRRNTTNGSPMSTLRSPTSHSKRLNWAEMICYTIAESPTGRLVIQDLFESMCHKFPDISEWAFDKDWEARVKNRIKSTLSIKSNLFIKVPRPSTASGKGSWWKLSDEAQLAYLQGRVAEVVRGNHGHHHHISSPSPKNATVSAAGSHYRFANHSHNEHRLSHELSDQQNLESPSFKTQASPLYDPSSSPWIPEFNLDHTSPASVHSMPVYNPTSLDMTGSPPLGRPMQSFSALHNLGSHSNAVDTPQVSGTSCSLPTGYLQGSQNPFAQTCSDLFSATSNSQSSGILQNELSDMLSPDSAVFSNASLASMSNPICGEGSSIRENNGFNGNGDQSSVPMFTTSPSSYVNGSPFPFDPVMLSLNNLGSMTTGMGSFDMMGSDNALNENKLQTLFENQALSSSNVGSTTSMPNFTNPALLSANSLQKDLWDTPFVNASLSNAFTPSFGNPMKVVGSDSPGETATTPSETGQGQQYTTNTNPTARNDQNGELFTYTPGSINGHNMQDFKREMDNGLSSDPNMTSIGFKSSELAAV